MNCKTDVMLSISFVSQDAGCCSSSIIVNQPQFLNQLQQDD